MITEKIIVDGRFVAKANEEMTPEIAATLGAVYGTETGKNNVIVVARDYRVDSRMLKRAFIAGALSAGVNVINLFAVPTPVLQFAIKRFAIDGGVIFTNSHNVKENTGFKIYERGGIEFSEKKIKSLFDSLIKNKIERVPPKEIGRISKAEDVGEIYQSAITQFVNKNLIRAKDLIVVADCANGPMGSIIPPIMNQLNIDLILLNSQEPDLDNVHPNINSIRRISKIIKTSDANLGVCFDVDGSRALFFDENGNYIESDDLLTLFVSEIIKNDDVKIIITTESTTKTIDEIVKKAGGVVRRVLNEPGAISSSIRSSRASFGGSDSGKYRFPEYAPFSDTILTTLKICEYMVKHKLKLSEIIQKIPKKNRFQDQIPVNEELIQKFQFKIEENISKYMSEYNVIDTLIGIKIFFGIDKGWININPRLNENILTFSAESDDETFIKNAIKTIKEILFS
ncbi:MAG: hypothetical protein EAX96_05410 [Candidatus Lokiarchaeota archaeon]|nr:hypothetical protein [Candidatus Lokiarchaeota archaeon]